MDDRRYLATIRDLARQMAESHHAYDSVIRSITSSAAIGQALAPFSERIVLAKSEIESITASLGLLSRMDTLSPSIRAMAEANASIKSIFESSSFIDAMRRSALESQGRWREEVLKDLGHSIGMAGITFKRDMYAMLSASLAAQSMLSELEPYRLGAAIHTAASLHESLRFALDEFAVTYSKLFDFIGHRPSNILEVEPNVIQHPPLEVFRETALLGEITIPEDKQDVLDEYEVPVVPEERSLEDWLRKIDTGLPDLLHGAREALNTANPDRARHVVASTRELITHVLHRLAPDDGIRAWTDDVHYYENGRPTRRARLLYINRGINVDPLSNFVDADVKSVLTLINALHAGAHEITSRLTDRQLRALVDRMESLLLFLLRLNSTNE
jgi:hypothetical protein